MATADILFGPDLAGEGVIARSTSEVGDWVADYIRNA